MKIVGNLALVILVCATFASEISYARASCKAGMYTRLDNGEAAMERVQFTPSINFREKLIIENINGRPYFNFERKSDEWTYFTYTDSNELLSARGYRDTSYGFNFEEMGIDRGTFLKFKDKAIVGFNFVCRM